MDIFENAVMYWCGWMKTEVFFENDHITVLDTKEHARMKESNDSKNARNCRGFCFENGDNKNFRFQSKTDTCALVNRSFKE